MSLLNINHPTPISLTVSTIEQSICLPAYTTPLSADNFGRMQPLINSYFIFSI